MIHRQGRWLAGASRGAWRLTGVVAVLACAVGMGAQELKYPKKPDAVHGGVVYHAGCVACHGETGKGAPQTSTEFVRPGTFPDFTRCDQTMPEPDSNWKAVIVHGGPGFGFSTIMPAFGELLSDEDINDVVAYLRTFCREPHWARGELNLPRALVTEKAYPEDEFVLSTAANATGAPGFTTDSIHEEQFGPVSQLEVDVPQHDEDQNHQWQNGVGDITVGMKEVLWASLHTGTIVSAQGGVLLPTGKSRYGFGAGTTTFEPFVSADQLFRTNTWIQFQMGADLPVDPKKSPQSLFYYTALGQTLAGDHRLGRQWSPMVELLANRDLMDGAKTDWDVMPEMQVTLSKRQHVRVDLGYRAPLTDTAGRQGQVDFYVLWDWADGKFWEGW
ncbi:MAG: c-type cytochrome [Acidobacteriota bacterium]